MILNTAITRTRIKEDILLALDREDYEAAEHLVSVLEKDVEENGVIFPEEAAGISFIRRMIKEGKEGV